MGFERNRGIRIVAVGDELLAGIGDPKSLGWLGRVSAKTPKVNPKIDIYSLPVPAETTEQLCGRWISEAGIRFDDHYDNRLILDLGTTDISHKIAIARSRLNLANILDQATSLGLKVFVVGPAPALTSEINVNINDLSNAFQDVTSRRGFHYVDIFSPLVRHDQWRTDLAANGGLYPGQAGYGLIAWLVLHRGWYNWLGISEA